MNEEILEVKNSYYEYVTNITPGLNALVINFRKGEYANAFRGLADFAEGIEWLLKIEEILSQLYIINSRINEANEFLKEINISLEMQDYTTVADLIEYEIAPIFDSASEWQFFEK